MYKFSLFLLFSTSVFSQNIDDLLLHKKWIFEANGNVIKSKAMNFTSYDSTKLSINNMIWTFLPGGKLTYDYKSDADVDACAGVDFLDLDLDESRWEFNDNTKMMTLTLKGGYASLDDFVIKKEFAVQYFDNKQGQVRLDLFQTQLLFYNDLTKNH